MANKLTPEEIKKALECCASGKNCEECSLNCKAPTSKDILDLINRQQETIETLRNCVKQHHIMRQDSKSPLSLLTIEIRTEAIKEFIEKFDGAIDEIKFPLSNVVDKTLLIAKQLAHKIAKEMVGDNK